MSEPKCFTIDCNWPANYWYIARGERVGYCFGHATWKLFSRADNYGRRERKHG